MAFKFLNFESYLVPIGASITDTLTAFRSAFSSRSWRIINDGSQMTWDAVVGDFPTTGSYQGANAFDENDSGSYAQLAFVAGKRIGLSLSTARQVAKFTIQPNAAVGDAPATWDLQWSDDGATWTTQQSYNYANWKPYVAVDFTVTTPSTHKYWAIQTNTKIVGTGNLSFSAIAFYDASGNKTCKFDSIHLDVLPPDTEAVGNANGYAFARLRFTANKIQFSTKIKYLTGFPQCFVINAQNGGTNQASITIGGVTVSQDPGTLAVGNTSYDNLYYLYLALKQSTNPTIQDWKFEYVVSAVQNGDESSLIRATRKTVTQTDVVVAGATNVTYAPNGYGYDAGYTTEFSRNYEGYNELIGSKIEATTDLVNGFVYFLSIYQRGFSIASKTNTNYFGPITIEWADNTKANACLPTPLTRYTTPVELFIIANGTATGIGGSTYDTNYARPSHYLAISNDHGDQSTVADPFGGRSLHPLQKVRFRGIIYDAAVPSGWGAVTNALASSGVWGGQSTGYVGNDFQVHRLTFARSFVADNDDSGFGNSTMIAPAVPLECHFMVAGTVANEQLLLVSDNTVAGNLVADMDGTTAFSELTISDTSKLADSGFIFIDANGVTEIVQYTGKDDNLKKLTGCTRNRYSSLRRPHFSGDEVRQGLWFCKINNAAMFCGYNRPS